MIPVGDSPVARRVPLVTWAVILVNVAVFLWMAMLSDDLDGTFLDRREDFRDQTATVCYGFQAPPTGVDRFYCEYGFQPAEFFDVLEGDSGLEPRDRWQAVLAILTSLFLHAGWLHIFGNMLFLWVFGDNVEDRLGHALFALFYVLSGVVAALTQAFADTASVIPTVGASGAVAGILGAYLVFFPKARVKVVIPFLILLFFPFQVPALLVIGLWFLQNLLAGLATLGTVEDPEGGIAYFAHLGGFVFGLLAALVLFRAVRPGRDAPRWSAR